MSKANITTRVDITRSLISVGRDSEGERERGRQFSPPQLRPVTPVSRSNQMVLGPMTSLSVAHRLPLALAPSPAPAVPEPEPLPAVASPALLLSAPSATMACQVPSARWGDGCRYLTFPPIERQKPGCAWSGISRGVRTPNLVTPCLQLSRVRTRD